MNKNVFVFSLFLVLGLLFSACQTTENASSKTASDKVSSGLESVVLPVQKSEAEIFSEKISGLTLSIESSPSRATKGSAFKKPFKASLVNAEKQPVVGFSVLVRYPVKNENGNVSFAESEIITDSDGFVVYTPSLEEISFTCDSELSFLLNPLSDDVETRKIAESTKVSAPWKVRTNRTWMGGLIGLVDYNSKGNSLSETFSSSLLLKELINSGFSNIGNFDIPRNKLNDEKAVYQHVFGMVGNSVSFLVYGTIKYESPIEQKDGLYFLTLQADFKCMDIKTGDILYSNIITKTSSDAVDWKVINVARQELAEEIAQLIIYNM